ncbi:ionotropic receptor 75a-like [Ochlerotatus camptorhynchus]|uniref:ionotropic receptor 75a-like n=1 Tax=Ochlerotatus camptorhynchus TaxID=644619 RepID=UPI0031D73C69
MDLACHKLSEEYSENFNMFRWILFNSATEVNDDLELPSALINYDVFHITTALDRYEISKILKHSPSSPLIEESYGYWQSENTPHLRLNASSETERWNLHGTPLKASIVCGPGDDTTATKVNKALTIALASLLNASITFHCAKDWETGLIGDLRAGSTDLGATPSFMTPDRIKSIQFLAMTGPLNHRYIFRSPKLSYTDNVFIASFHSHVWLSIVGIILLATVLQLIITRFGQCSETNRASEAAKREGASGALLSMISIASQQEALLSLRSVSSRTMTVVMLISLMFLYISFSASIVVLIQSPSTRVRTLGDLVRSGFELTAQDSAIERNFLANASTYMQFKSFSGGFIGISEGTERIRRGLNAFHGDTNLIYRYMVDHYREDEKCNLQAINLLHPLLLNGYYTVAKDSPFKEHVKFGLLKLRELGFQQRQIAIHYQRKPPCIGESVFAPVSMIDAIFSLQLMGWAMVITIIIFALEIALKRYNNIMQTVRARCARKTHGKVPPKFKHN